MESLLVYKNTNQTLAFKEVHIASEFAGYGTAELAVESIANICGEMGFQMRMTRTSGDMNPHCQKLLLENSDGCVFGNTLGLLPDTIRDEIEKGKTFQVKLSSGDVKSAAASVHKAKAIDLFTSKGRLICKIGETVERDMVLVGVPGDQNNSRRAMKRLDKLLHIKQDSKTEKFVSQRRTKVVEKVLWALLRFFMGWWLN